MDHYEPFNLSDLAEPSEPVEPASLNEPTPSPLPAVSPETSDTQIGFPELPDTVALNEPLDGVSFTTNPPPVAAAPKKVVRTVAPGLVTRVLAKIIDGAVAGVLYTLCTVFITDWFIGFLAGGIVASLYFIVSDGVNMRHMPRRSFGKKVMGLVVARIDKEPMNVWTSAQRNWMFGVLYFVQAFTFNAPAVSILLTLAAVGLIGYEVYWVVVNPRGIRWGDDIAGTEVRQLVTEIV